VHNVEPPDVALDMAGGPDDEFAIVRWTAPSTGAYHIVGVFYGFGSTLSDVHVLRGRFPVFDGNVAGLCNANFSLTAFLKAGATLDFALHVTPQNFTNGGANTAMQVAISQGPMDKYQTYDVPNASGTWLRGINEYGVMVGSYTDADGLNHGFLLEGSRLPTIDFPGATETYPRTINNRGQIVGFFFDANSVYHGFLFDQGTFQQFDYPDALATLTRGVNDRGQIVGDYMDETNIHAFILGKGKFTVFDYPGAPGTQGYGINNSDLSAGSCDSADCSTLHAYLTYNGKFVSFDAPGSTQTEFLGLNDLGHPSATTLTEP
jgi:probable HAF family extracellular repeat protein